MKKQIKKTFFHSLIFNLFLISSCYSATNSQLPLVVVNQNLVNDFASETTSYGTAAVDPREYEKEYYALIKEAFDKDPKNKEEFIKQLKETNLQITETEIAAAIEKAHKTKAINYAHYQYSNERSMSLNFDSLTPEGDLKDAYGTGWFVDRLKNADGTWSNDFIVSTNVHVINQINRLVDVGADNPNLGYANSVLELKIGKLPFNWTTINSSTPTFLARNHYHPVTGWKGDNSFSGNNRIQLSNIKNLNISENVEYFLDFSSFNQGKIVEAIWEHIEDYLPKNLFVEGFFDNHTLLNELLGKKIPFNQSEQISKFLPDDVNPVLNKNNFFSPSLAAMQNLDLNQYVDQKTGIPEKIQEALLKRASKQFHSDQAFLKLNIDDEVLNNLFPLFANPEKYNEWTFPRIIEEEKFPSPFTLQTETFYAYAYPRKSFHLKDDEKFQIWHAGYPLEQSNRDLNYRSTGPAFKGATGDVVSYNVTTATNKDVGLNLDYNLCYIYSEFCKNDHVKIAGYNIEVVSEHTTGGGSSGSLAIDENYNAIGIYWGETRDGQGITFANKALYNPFKISELSSRATVYEPLIDASTAIIPYDKNGYSGLLLRQYFTNLFRAHYRNNFVYSFYSSNPRNKALFDNIDFSSNETIDRDIYETLFVGTNPTFFNNPLNLSEYDRMTLVLRFIKKYSYYLYNEVAEVDAKNQPLLNEVLGFFEVYPNLVNYKITPFYTRRLGEMDIKKQLNEFLVSHSIKSYLHNQ